MALVKERQKKKLTVLKGDARWNGITNIASGDTTVVVSATQVKSGQNFLTSLGITSVASHQSLRTSVNSLVTNTSMVVQVDKATVGNQQVCWTIIENI